MERCKTCKHWVKPGNPKARDLCDPLDQDTFEPMRIGFEVRECTHPSKGFHATPTERDGFAITDASNYFAALCTAEEYGCVQRGVRPNATTNERTAMTVLNNEDPADPSAHEPRVTGAPEAIWLVYGELEHDDTHANCADSGEVTWCEDAQFPADVRYTRTDLVAEIEAAAKAAERKSIAQRLAAESALEGFGCACTPQRVCGTCTARDTISKALAPLMRELGA
jgi:hypothetical protein